MSEKIIKSDDRVKNWGEVFTPKKTVDFMLNQPEIAAKVNDLSATFLEPSAGEGAFLVELLKRKLKVAKKKSKSVAEMQDNFLLGLSTLYGIELMSDNVKYLIDNMNATFAEAYFAAFDKENQDENVLKSAKAIININMVQGDTLAGKTKSGAPIMISEWKPLPNGKVQRIEQTFESIVKESEGNSTGAEQLDLFDTDDSAGTNEFSPVDWKDIYKITNV